VRFQCAVLGNPEEPPIHVRQGPASCRPRRGAAESPGVRAWRGHSCRQAEPGRKPPNHWSIMSMALALIIKNGNHSVVLPGLSAPSMRAGGIARSPSETACTPRANARPVPDSQPAIYTAPQFASELSSNRPSRPLQSLVLSLHSCSAASSARRAKTKPMAAHLACAFFFAAEPVGEPCVHALDACALCAKPLARDSDIFMYRGDTPFCSEECRYEQMQLDAIRARQPYASGTEARRGHREASKVSAVAT
jgi:hypothetical protein